MLQILICTHNEGIREVPNILLPEAEGIGYVVSMQYSDARYLNAVPAELRYRKDVVLSVIAGQGLSANRNNAIACATAEVCVVADDDVRYELADLQRIVAAHAAHPEAGVILFQAKGPQGELLKNYPQESFNYPDIPKGYYPSSIEITFKRVCVKDIPFDLRFGIGSKGVACGEEEVWLHTLYRKAGQFILYLPFSVVRTLESPQGGANFAMRPEIQRAKGATLYYLYGMSAWLRCFKASLFTACSVKNAHFFTLLRNTARGILYIMRTGR